MNDGPQLLSRFIISSLLRSRFLQCWWPISYRSPIIDRILFYHPVIGKSKNINFYPLFVYSFIAFPSLQIIINQFWNRQSFKSKRKRSRTISKEFFPDSIDEKRLLFVETKIVEKKRVMQHGRVIDTWLVGRGKGGTWQESGACRTSHISGDEHSCLLPTANFYPGRRIVQQFVQQFCSPVRMHTISGRWFKNIVHPPYVELKITT